MSENYFMGLDGFVWFTGVVEDRNDPFKIGRVRVRCLGYHTPDKEKIPTEDLPWAQVMHPVTDPSMQGMGNTPSFLVEGTWVVGFFMDAQEKQRPIIMGTLPGLPEYRYTSPDGATDAFNPRAGFNDPSGKYPQNPNSVSGHDIKESDTNRLARNDTDQTHKVIESKDTAYDLSTAPTGRTTGVYAYDGLQWNEPSAAESYNSTYPNNHVYETESGHIREYDDSTSGERIHEYHKTGTFYEIDASGNKSIRIVGSKYEVVVGSEHVNIKGSVNLTVDGNLNTHVKGDMNTVVDGDKVEVIRGDSSVEVLGTVEEVYGSTQRTDVEGEVTQVYGANLNTDITGTYNLDTTGQVDFVFGGNHNVDIEGTLDMDVSTEIDLQSATINLNKGTTSVTVPIGLTRTATITDPQSLVQRFFQAADVPEGYVNNHQLAKRGSDVNEELEQDGVVDESFVDNERYVGKWNEFDSDYQIPNPNNLQYITKNNADVLALKNKAGDRWVDDFFLLKTDGASSRRTAFTKADTQKFFGKDDGTQSVTHADGAFVDPPYETTFWNWDRQASDRRIRKELGLKLDTLAVAWQSKYPDLAKLQVTSGYRTIRANLRNSGGIAHRTGKAVDVVIPGVKSGEVVNSTLVADFLQLAFDNGFTGIGTYNGVPSRYRIHLDILRKRRWHFGGVNLAKKPDNPIRDVFKDNGYFV